MCSSNDSLHIQMHQELPMSLQASLPGKSSLTDASCFRELELRKSHLLATASTVLSSPAAFEDGVHLFECCSRGYSQVAL